MGRLDDLTPCIHIVNINVAHVGSFLSKFNRDFHCDLPLLDQRPLQEVHGEPVEQDGKAAQSCEGAQNKV